MPKAKGVFISYRRIDSRHVAGRLTDDLKRAFGSEAVFRDIDDIAPGDDFERTLDDALAACSVLLAIIGPAWLEQLHQRNERTDGTVDYVRRELETALHMSLHVIPVLVDGASMPGKHSLPDSIQGLTRFQGHRQTDESWRHDVSSLLRKLETLLDRPAENPFLWGNAWLRSALKIPARIHAWRAATVAAAIGVGVLAVFGPRLSDMAGSRWSDRDAREDVDIAFLIPPEGESADPADAIQMFNDMQSVLRLALDSPYVNVVPETVDLDDFRNYRLDRKEALLTYGAPRNQANLFIHAIYGLDVPSSTRRLVVTPYLRPSDTSGRWRVAEGWTDPLFIGPVFPKHVAIKASFELVEFLAARSLLRLQPADVQRARLTLLREYRDLLRIRDAPCQEVEDLIQTLQDTAQLHDVASDAARMRSKLKISCARPDGSADAANNAVSTATAVYRAMLSI